MAHDPPDPSDTLTRFGRDAESVESLCEQAAQAEKIIGVHGVSVRLNSKRRGKKARLAETVTAFPETRQMGADSKHYTVVLPQPITQEVADRFNALFPPQEH